MRRKKERSTQDASPPTKLSKYQRKLRDRLRGTHPTLLIPDQEPVKPKLVSRNQITGVITSIKDGFGFIKVEGREDHFFHFSVRPDVFFTKKHEGVHVILESQVGKRGPAATEIVFVNGRP